jgi:hypothetical protein
MKAFGRYHSTGSFEIENLSVFLHPQSARIFRLLKPVESLNFGRDEVKASQFMDPWYSEFEVKVASVKIPSLRGSG